MVSPRVDLPSIHKQTYIFTCISIPAKKMSFHTYTFASISRGESITLSPSTKRIQFPAKGHPFVPYLVRNGILIYAITDNVLV